MYSHDIYARQFSFPTILNTYYYEDEPSHQCTYMEGEDETMLIDTQ